MHFETVFGKIPYSVVMLYVPLVLAFLADIIFAKQHGSLRRLWTFKPSVRKDVLYSAIYMIGWGVLLSRWTPFGIIETQFVKGLKPIIPLGGIIANDWSYPVLATLFALTVTDFAHYWVHRALHTWPILWNFHAVHHAADEMCIFTGNRVAFTEKALNDVSALLLVKLLGLSTGNFFWILFLRRAIDLVQHSNLGWTYGRCGYFFASPVNHHFHHSDIREDWDQNYGNILSVWDHIFGTANKKMTQINRAWIFHDLPRIGLPPGVEPFNKGIWSWPVMQDLAIWGSAIPLARKTYQRKREETPQ